jgi:hypothetical protein
VGGWTASEGLMRLLVSRWIAPPALAAVVLLAPTPAQAGAPVLSQKHRDPAHKFSLPYFKDWAPVPVETGEKYEVAKLCDSKSTGSRRGTTDPEIVVVRFVKDATRDKVTTPSEGPPLPPELLRRLRGPEDAFDAAMARFTFFLPEGVQLPKQAFKKIESKDKVPGRMWVLDLPSQWPGETIFVTLAVFEKDGVEFAVRMACGGQLRKDFEKPFAEVAKKFMWFDEKAPEVESLDVLDGVNITAARRREIEKGMVKDWDVIVSPKKQYVVLYNNKRGENHALAKLIAERIEAIRAQIYEVQFPPATPITSVSICRVCKDAQEYHQYGGPGGSAGYWNSGTEELVFYDASESKKEDVDTLAVLYHEAFHQFIYYSVGEVAPHSWFNEGHGDYYAGAKYVNGKFKIGPFAWRVGLARNAIVEGPRPRTEVKDDKTGAVQVQWGNTGYTPLKDLVAFSQNEYYSYMGVSYAQGWALIYFLREIVPANKKYAEKWGKILPTYFDTLKAGVNRPAPKEPPPAPEGPDAPKGKDEPPRPSPDAPSKPGDPPKPDGEPKPQGEPQPPQPVEVPRYYGRGDPKALENALAKAFEGIDWVEFEEAWKKATKSGK